MRLLRVQHSPRRTVIYHPSFGDLLKRLRCLLGAHEYETVLEYPSVGAKEEMCLHCLKERYSISGRHAPVFKAANPA